MEKTLLELMMTAGKNLMPLFAKKWEESISNEKSQRRIDDWVRKNYENLRIRVTGNCVRLLQAVEYGKTFRIEEFRKVLHATVQLPPHGEKLLDLEFLYRLEYLSLLGLLAKTMREYTISRLGVSFLAEARKRKDFPEVLP